MRRAIKEMQVDTGVMVDGVCYIKLRRDTYMEVATGEIYRTIEGKSIQKIKWDELIDRISRYGWGTTGLKYNIKTGAGLRKDKAGYIEGASRRCYYCKFYRAGFCENPENRFHVGKDDFGCDYWREDDE